MGNGMNKIIPGLYLGNFRDAKDQFQLESNKITHIISIHEVSKPLYEDKKYLCIMASDTSSQNVSQYFSQTNNFIHEARVSGGNALVHCLAGVSRSSTVVIAYLMTITGFTWRECLAAVQLARPCANPNFGFQRQLLDFQYSNLTEETKRLLDNFPDSKDLLEGGKREVRNAADSHKKQQDEKENLREEVRQILEKSVQSAPSVKDSMAGDKNGVKEQSSKSLPKTENSVHKLPTMTCQEIKSSLDSLLQTPSNSSNQ